jgi:hypothetical protein
MDYLFLLIPLPILALLLREWLANMGRLRRRRSAG